MNTIYGDGWVKVRPWFNKKFPTMGGCERCRSFTCAPGWLNLSTKIFRCTKCFDPRTEAAA